MLVNDMTGEPIQDPVPEVIQQMLVVSHDFNTSVVTRSGKTKKASVVLRPIKDDKHALIGVFMRIKEKTLGEIRMASRKT